MRIECTPEELIRLSMLLSGQAKAGDHAGVEWLVSSARTAPKSALGSRSKAREGRFRPRVDFGPTLKELRAKAGFSVRELCKRSGVSGRSIFLWESGKTPPSNLKKVAGVANALGVELSVFEASESEDPHPADVENSDEPRLAGDPIGAAKDLSDKPAEDDPDPPPNLLGAEEQASVKSDESTEGKVCSNSLSAPEQDEGAVAGSGRLRQGEAGIIEKRCSKCKTWYPADHVFFFGNKGAAGNVTDYCKACSRERRRRIGTFDPPEFQKPVFGAPNADKEPSVSVEDLMKRRDKALAANSLGEARMYEELIEERKHVEQPAMAV